MKRKELFVRIQTSMKDQINSAQIVVACRNLDQTLEFFIERLGFRLEMIFPADAPWTAVISGFGTTLRLEEALEEASEIQPVALRLLGDFSASERFVSFENIKLIFENPEAQPETPDDTYRELVISNYDPVWHPGRAGMEYRDLIPSRMGGRFIASRIRIEKGGPVPDYVHYHKIRFQMIYCLSGWSKLVYEDQGPPFLMKAGDCVLQPPEIRHRVLECSDGFEVLEIGCFADHQTWVDHRMELPNDKYNPDRIFSGQRFVHHSAETGIWKNSELENIESMETGIAGATQSWADVQTLRAIADTAFSIKHPDEFLFFFVRAGQQRLIESNGQDYLLKMTDSFVLPRDEEYFLEVEKGMEMVRVRVPSLQPRIQ
jgi:quercetin dioxygenase-like cupin family protein